MSRDFPQSISPQRGSRHNSLASDANIRNFAPVARIMKTALPENAKIAKEAKECMQECVSEFISFITSEGTSISTSAYRLASNIPLAASEKCQQEKRKTVNGEDILFAMTSLGFENYAEALKIYLSKYREVSRLIPLVGLHCILHSALLLAGLSVRPPLHVAEPQMTIASRPSQPEAKTSSGQEVDTVPKVVNLGQVAGMSAQGPAHLQHQQRTISKAKMLIAS